MLPRASTPTRLVDAAISISNPFDLPRLNRHFQSGVPVLYAALVAQPLKRILWEGRHQLPLTREQFVRGMLCASVEEFDRQVQVRACH